MSTEQWLLLTDYSSKYRVSVSTLRRRIKNNQIPFRFEAGKYFLIDASPNHPEVTAHQKPTPFFEGLKTLAVEAAPLKTSALDAFKESLPSEYGFNEYSDQRDAELGLPPRVTAKNQVEPIQSSSPSEEAQEFEQQTPTYAAPEFSSANVAENSANNSFDNSAENVAGIAIESSGSEPILTTATNLLNELKRAYSNILQEKEEQMIQLKEEVSDLKTLVRVLEDETDRLRRQINEYHRAFERSRSPEV